MTSDLPPANIEAEEAILGSILFDPDLIATLPKILPVEAFFVGAHQTIYRSMISVAKKGYKPDLLNLTDYLNGQNVLETVGGTTKLSQLLNRTVSASNCDRYVRLIIDKYKRRQLIALGSQIKELGYDQAQDLAIILGEIRASLPEELFPTPEEDKQPIITKARYTIKSKSGLHQIELEAEVDNGRELTGNINNLKSRAEGLARQIWSQHVDPNVVD